jgi:Fe-S cluster biogenesis protein NfuA
MQQSATDRSDSSSRSAILARIEQVLDEQVRPDLRSDGGDIELVGIDQDLIVQVRLTGACQGCSSALITMTMRVESAVKAAVPEVRFVEAVL